MVGTHIRYHWKAKMLICRFMLVIKKGFLRGGGGGGVPVCL